MTEAIVQKCSVRKAVLRNFTNFIFNKVAGLREVAGLNSGLNSLFLKRFSSLGRKATSGIQCFFHKSSHCLPLAAVQLSKNNTNRPSLLIFQVNYPSSFDLAYV